MNNVVTYKNRFKQEIKVYFLGFIYSLILTIIPFFLVLKRFFNPNITLLIVICCAFIQFFVHLKYFLHLTFNSENYWNIIFLIFTMVIISIIILGSIWIMYNLKQHFIYHQYNNL
ncbi:cytochrome o ubiquinol oxidase subunit IV [Buchnera aphidicola (Takecallis taiwana)]|uniref:cytochrome o ubiquinol oxidase subunit IV n=1 Tax=Buchnera aphidicola TaxID=9 RepID=UPI0031B6BC8B